MKQEIFDEIIASIKQDMDNQILYELYIRLGWTHVTLDIRDRIDKISDIEYWLNTKTTKCWLKHGDQFVFEDEKDATMFILGWC